MKTDTACTLNQYLEIVPAESADYDELARFHYRGGSTGPVRCMFKLIDHHPWRSLAAPVVGIIVYGKPSANLAVRNRALEGLFGGLDRSAALSLLNDRMSCIRRVIIEPRYRGLGLASRLVADTLRRCGTPMVEAVSMMGRSHPFFERAGMQAYTPEPDLKTERLQAAFEAAGLKEPVTLSSGHMHASIEALPEPLRGFVTREMEWFCQKFTNRRMRCHSPNRTAFILSKLTERPRYYLWTRSQSGGEL
jgi:hypothetical protein